LLADAAADALDRAAGLYQGGQEAAGSLELAIALLRVTLARDKARDAAEHPAGLAPQRWQLEDLGRAEGFLSQVRPLHDLLIGTPRPPGDRTRYLRYAGVDGSVAWYAAPAGAQYQRWVQAAAAGGGTLTEEDQPPPMDGQPRGERKVWEAALAGGWAASFAPGYRSDLLTPLTYVNAHHHPQAGTVKMTWIAGRQRPGAHTLKQALQLIRGHPAHELAAG
jgi:hypothetical protein